MGKRTRRFDTLAIHGAAPHKEPHNALNDPIYMTSAFTFDSVEHAEKTFNFETEDFVYTRGNNPTLRLLEQRLAVLEQGEEAVAFASGMAAISSTLFSLLKPGDEMIAHPVLYGSAHNVITKLLPAYGIDTRLVDLTDPARLAVSLGPRTRTVYCETPANPNLAVIDIAAVAEICHENGARLVVDNTFATPYFQQPLALGADVVVHSATKYIGGHGDVVGGIAVARDRDYAAKLKFEYMCEFGGVLSPFNGWLLLRGLKTLGLRMRQHQHNAMEAARFLAGRQEVKQVFYPGLPDFPGHALAQKQMTGYGAMVSFTLRGGEGQSRQVVENLQLAKLAVSLGDCETLVEHPFAMTHRSYSPREIQAAGLSPTLIRLSVGLEDPGDIVADLAQALDRVDF